MRDTICITSVSLGYPEGGGAFWAYLNWALGIRDLGFDVIWLEAVSANWTSERLKHRVQQVREQLVPYGLDSRLAICARSGRAGDIGADGFDGCLNLDDATQSRLLINLRYDLDEAVVKRFRRTAVIDIDPGIVQHYIARGDLQLARHDVYFSISSTVGTPAAKFTDAGIHWHHTPPAVHLESWPTMASRPPDATARFTTVSQWYMKEWIVEPDGSYYRNDKRSGFEPLLDLPSHVPHVPMELAINLDGDAQERQRLVDLGWHVRESRQVSSSLDQYRQYIQQSRGEFSCAKPSYVHQQTGWLSDRTICYLASGRPAIVQHTGPNPILPDNCGLFRFRDLHQAAQ